MPKCTGSMPKVLITGRKIGVPDQQHRRQIHECAEQQQQNVDVKQKRVFVARDRDEKLRDLRRYAHDRHHVAEGDREADHDHDHADGTHDARDQLSAPRST